MAPKQSAFSGSITQFLLLANFIVMSIIAYMFWTYLSSSNVGPSDSDLLLPTQSIRTIVNHNANIINASAGIGNRGSITTAVAGTGSIDSGGFYFVHPKEGERDFYSVGKTTGTDKVEAPGRLPGCLQNDASCTRPNCVRPECRPCKHMYKTHTTCFLL